MAIAFVRGQSKQNVGSTSQVFSSLTASATGNLLIAELACKTGSSQSVSTVTDNAGSTWTKRQAGWASGVNSRAEVWTAIAAGAVTSITVTPTATMAMNLYLLECSVGGGTLDFSLISPAGTAASDAVSDTTFSAGSLTPPSGAQGVYVAGVSAPLTTTAATLTPSAGFSNIGAATTNSSTLHGGAAAYQVIASGSGSAVAASFTSTVAATNGWASIFVSESAAPASAYPLPQTPLMQIEQFTHLRM